MVEAIENGADEVRRWDDVETRATAIRIGNPVNAPKALPGIRETGGTAVAVSDEAITEAQRATSRARGSVSSPPRLLPSPASENSAPRELSTTTNASPVSPPVTCSRILTPPLRRGANEPVPADTEGVLDHLRE